MSFETVNKSSTFFLNKDIKNLKRRLWTEEEDILLVQWISSHGPSSWKDCGLFIKTKTANQCRDRWNYSVSPAVQNIKWDKYDDYILFKLYILIGPKWSRISKVLPGRSSRDVKNRFNAILKHKRFKMFTESNIKDQKSINIIEKLMTWEIDEVISNLPIHIGLESQGLKDSIQKAFNNYTKIKVEFPGTETCNNDDIQHIISNNQESSHNYSSISSTLLPEFTISNSNMICDDFLSDKLSLDELTSSCFLS